MTINKSQGQTLEQVGLYLHDHVFTHGQMYVALSRVTSCNVIKVLIDKKIFHDGSECTKYIKNIVYQEIFEDITVDFL